MPHCTCARVPQDKGVSLNIQLLLWLHKKVAHSLAGQLCLVLFARCSRSFPVIRGGQEEQGRFWAFPVMLFCVAR